MFEYAAWCLTSTRDPLGVVDGDTMNVGVDLGLDVAINITLRLYGINAPEMSTPEGVADIKFTVKTIKDHRDKYGRYLAVVTAPDGAVFNDDIVAAGHAVPYFPKTVKGVD